MYVALRRNHELERSQDKYILLIAQLQMTWHQYKTLINLHAFYKTIYKQYHNNKLQY